MGTVELRGIQKSYGATVILPHLDLSIKDGEFVALVGPSGCGKSTILRMLAGLDDPTKGSISIDGREVGDVSPNLRGVSMVFQSYALYPHMTVAQNLTFPLKMAKLDSAEIEKRVSEIANILGLTELLGRKPSQLSGGQKQRVAMGRAMVKRPKVLLFDEPLSNLDAQLRVKVRSEIAVLHRKVRSTVVYVTHDQVEAMTLADRIAVLNGGNLEQFDTPDEIYRNPHTRFVASFIGTPAMNFVAAQSVSAVGLKVPAGADVCGFRSENAHLQKTTSGDTSYFEIAKGRVSLIESLGSVSHVHIRTEDMANSGSNLIVEIKDNPDESSKAPRPRYDEEVKIWTKPGALFFFDNKGQRVRGGNS
jgi:ABC-type sugar transport system ATPase subunit